jgi:hypothetical protein
VKRGRVKRVVTAAAVVAQQPHQHGGTRGGSVITGLLFIASGALVLGACWHATRE